MRISLLANWTVLGISAALLSCGGPAQIDTSSPEISAFMPGSEFSDCEDCPSMVVLPAGTFMMGSPSGERFRGAEPLHEVVIAEPFAVGKYEITFDEWNACLADGGCDGYAPTDHGWGQGDRPVIQVHFDDVLSYVAWLSQKTGHAYRLLSETEWEYAARAGTQSPFSFGDTISSELANYDGRTGYDGGPTGEFREQTLPVGSFEPNAFGLYDMHGNVWEWVQDCWNDIYTETMPNDGSAWLDGDCSGRIMRGGSWEDYSGELRSAARVGSGRDESYWSDGFRVARALD
jgi:formylglycine-generating enzyme required for sulfatase activity